MGNVDSKIKNWSLLFIFIEITDCIVTIGSIRGEWKSHTKVSICNTREVQRDLPIYLKILEI